VGRQRSRGAIRAPGTGTIRTGAAPHAEPFGTVQKYAPESWAKCVESVQSLWQLHRNRSGKLLPRDSATAGSTPRSRIPLSESDHRSLSPSRQQCRERQVCHCDSGLAQSRRCGEPGRSLSTRILQLLDVPVGSLYIVRVGSYHVHRSFTTTQPASRASLSRESSVFDTCAHRTARSSSDREHHRLTSPFTASNPTSRVVAVSVGKTAYPSPHANRTSTYRWSRPASRSSTARHFTHLTSPQPSWRPSSAERER